MPTQRDELSPRSVVVTGASGFVGSRLCRALLDEGWMVHALHIPGCDLSQLPPHPMLHLHPTIDDVNQMTCILQQASPQLVIHLASLFLSEHRSQEVASLLDSNIKLGTLVLEAMRTAGITKLINTGTSWQHYQSAAFSPVNLYAATKQAFEDILIYYAEACDFKAITLKLYDTYGPDDPRPKVVNLLLSAALSGETLEMSPGDQILDLVHVKDVCRAYLHAAALLAGEGSGHSAYGVASEERVTLKELVNLFNSVAPRKANVAWGRRPYRAREVMVPWSTGAPLPRWKAKVSLRDGLLQVVQQRKW